MSQALASRVLALMAPAQRGAVVMVVGEGSESIAHELRDAGCAAHAVPAMLDAVSGLDAQCTAHADLTPSLLVLGHRDTPDGALSWSSRLAAHGARLGWVVTPLHDAVFFMSSATAPALRMRWIGVAEGAVMRELFRSLFGHEMDLDHWRWKYEGGGGSGLGLWMNGELVAHYGGMTRAVRAFGQPMLACQVCDVMVSAKGRATLARNGPLVRLTSTFLEHQIGHGLPHAIGFGFPSERAFGVAQRLGLYVAVDEIVMLQWPAEGRARQSDRLVRVAPLMLCALQEGSHDWRRIERLWQAMARSFSTSVLGERTPQWLRRRYGQRPGVIYEALVASSLLTGQWRGMVVMRTHDTYLEIVDLIAVPAQFGTLIHLARRHAALKGLQTVQAWITASHQGLLGAKDGEGDAATGCEVHKIGIQVPANVHTAGPDPARLVGKWFLMSGDSDFR